METTSSAPGRILIVEDEAIVARTIQRHVTQLGYEVCAIAASGETAIEAAREHRPDIALMDIVLSGDIDGIETAEAIRKLYQIPVVSLTADADSHTLQRARQIEPLGYIAKPFSARELGIVTERALHRAAEQRQIRNVEAALRMSESRSRTAIETAADAIVIVDDQGNVQVFNLAAGRIFGYRADDVVGRSVSMLMPEALGPRNDRKTAAYLRAVIAKSIGTCQQVQGRRSDGGTVPLDLAIAAWTSEGCRYFTGTMRDITERQRHDQILQQRNAELARCNARLDHFAHVVGHDFRMPLRALRNSAQWIVEDLGDHVSDDIRGHVARISEHTARLTAMLDDLLAYAHAGIGAASPHEIDLDALVGNIQRHLEAEANSRIEIAGPVGTIFAARAALEIVLRNLIQNAIRHTDQEIASISIRCREEEQALHFAVSDDGPGIAPEHHARIFTPFIKIASPRTGQGGTGMGLALVRRVVEDNGGVIEVDSDPVARRGATFRFTWAKQLPRGGAA